MTASHDPCPCGSGYFHRRCCGRGPMAGGILDLLEKAMTEFAAGGYGPPDDYTMALAYMAGAHRWRMAPTLTAAEFCAELDQAYWERLKARRSKEIRERIA